MDAAIAWLLPRQGDPALDAPWQARPPPGAPPAGQRAEASAQGRQRETAAPSAVSTPGVAGILRREQQQAAAQEQCALLVL